ncbi:MAG: hypothetical protein H8D43_01620 [Chloroflexi bacterium]|nr:hypothetical protein [Chloroflexota bacterium]
MSDNTRIGGGLVILVIIMFVFAKRDHRSRKSTRYFTDVTPEDLKLQEGPGFFYSEEEGRVLPRSGHRTNGKMPDLLLSPMRVYGPVTLGTMALIAFLFAFLQ